MKRILLIEDDDSIRYLVLNFLKLAQFDCIEARNGNEAITALQQDHFDLILCDINLPDMQGNEILAHVKSDARLKDVPFVVISAYTSQQDIDRIMSLGACDYITKPFANRDLIERIKKALK